MWGISWLAEEMLAPQGGFSAMELIIWLVRFCFFVPHLCVIQSACKFSGTKRNNVMCIATFN